MSSDYEAISANNVKQLGEDTRSRMWQICIYSDFTHFIYEILQNADDYAATEIVFTLTPSELVVEHNGEPFVEENVKAITYFGKSTSAESLVKTGHFGIGFKSVFMFTASPIIFSGDEHFRIHKLYQVSEHSCPRDLVPGRTRIVLPFNHETEKPNYVEKWISAQEAYQGIGDRLRGIGLHTLLFLRSIEP